MAGGVVGLDKLMRKLGGLENCVSSEIMERAVGASAKRIQGEAKLLCPVDTGELRGSIRTNVETRDSVTIGTVYTNKEYAQYVEFGTGPVGEANHAGISPNVNPVYSQTGWIIPRDGVGAGDKIGYTEGQPARPFMYPALKNNEERVSRNISNYIAREIRKASQ